MRNWSHTWCRYSNSGAGTVDTAHNQSLTTVIRDAAKHHPLLMLSERRSQSAEPAIQSNDSITSAMEKTTIGCTFGLRTRLLYRAEKMMENAPRKLCVGEESRAILQLAQVADMLQE